MWKHVQASVYKQRVKVSTRVSKPLHRLLQRGGQECECHAKVYACVTAGECMCERGVCVRGVHVCVEGGLHMYVCVGVCVYVWGLHACVCEGCVCVGIACVCMRGVSVREGGCMCVCGGGVVLRESCVYIWDSISALLLPLP